MYWRMIAALVAGLAVAGCGGNPFGNEAVCGKNPFSPEECSTDGDVDGGDDDGTDGDGTTTEDARLPAAVAQNVDQAATAAALQDWVAAAPTLQITIDAQDLSGPYDRDPTLNLNGYEAYTYQSTTSNRKVVALIKTAGTVTSMVAVDGGQFAEYHGGGAMYRTDVFTVPTETEVNDQKSTGRFNYSGSYVGLLNTGTPTPSGPDGSLNPEQATRTTGRALITADFAEMRVSGGVDQRSQINNDGSTGPALAAIALTSTNIAADGSFTNSVQRLDPTGYVAAGTYGGLFGGIDASEVAAVLVFNPVSSSSELFEHGQVVLSNCVATGGAAACP